eukprot:6491803-Amphidinium_carterae.3
MDVGLSPLVEIVAGKCPDAKFHLTTFIERTKAKKSFPSDLPCVGHLHAGHHRTAFSPYQMQPDRRRVPKRSYMYRLRKSQSLVPSRDRFLWLAPKEEPLQFEIHVGKKTDSITAFLQEKELEQQFPPQWSKIVAWSGHWLIWRLSSNA